MLFLKLNLQIDHLNTNIQTQITALNALKAKIDADTDAAILKTDIQSIAQAYRIFMLIIPQGNIAAAADRQATIINALVGIGKKLPIHFYRYIIL